MKQHFIGDAKEMPPTNCINCGHVFELASAIDDNVRPKPGDVSICIECGHLAIYTKTLQLRELTGKELIKVAGDPRIVAVQTARQKIKG